MALTIIIMNDNYHSGKKHFALLIKQRCEELDGPAVSAIAEVKQRWSVMGWVTKTF
jgi:hypothetical protein